MSVADQIVSAIARQSNRLGRIRDAVYLDTNAWSTLIKGHIPCEPLWQWVSQTSRYIWMSRFQLAELTRDDRLVRPLAEILRIFPVVLVDRGQNEFQGEPWYRVKIDYEKVLVLGADDLCDAFVNEFVSGPLQQAHATLAKDSERFRQWLERALKSIPGTRPRTWDEFPRRLNDWVRFKCEQNGIEANEAAIDDPDCYIGLKLSYSILFLRYFVNRQAWKTSDYVDYLHVADMAYSGVVVTEKNLVDCLKQASRRPELRAPKMTVGLKWLANPASG